MRLLCGGALITYDRCRVSVRFIAVVAHTSVVTTTHLSFFNIDVYHLLGNVVASKLGWEGFAPTLGGMKLRTWVAPPGRLVGSWILLLGGLDPPLGRWVLLLGGSDPPLVAGSCCYVLGGADPSLGSWVLL